MFSDQLYYFSGGTSLISTLIFFLYGIESIFDHMLGSYTFKSLRYFSPFGPKLLGKLEQFNVFSRRPFGMFNNRVEVIEPHLSATMS